MQKYEYFIPLYAFLFIPFAHAERQTISETLKAGKTFSVKSKSCNLNISTNQAKKIVLKCSGQQTKHTEKASTTLKRGDKAVITAKSCFLYVDSQSANKINLRCFSTQVTPTPTVTATATPSHYDTRNVIISGNLDASASLLASGASSIHLADLAGSGAAINGASFADINNTPAEFSLAVDIYDTLAAKHTLTLFFFHTATSEYTARAYVKSEDTDTPAGDARQVTTLGGDSTSGTFTLAFNGDATMTAASKAAAMKQIAVQFNNGSDPSSFKLDLSNFTQFSGNSNIQGVVQDGRAYEP